MALIKATPPPGTIPSSTAARAVDKASSTRCFFSLSSGSVAPPTLRTATPPANLAKRSWSFSRSKSLVVCSIWLRICSIRALMAFSLPLPSMMVVLSLSDTTRRARPRSSMVALSSLRPTSSLIKVPPVKMAMSWSMALRRSPKPGALTANTLTVPRSLLTTKVAKASPSISSEMMTRFLVTCKAFSSTGKISWIALIFLSVMRM